MTKKFYSLILVAMVAMCASSVAQAADYPAELYLYMNKYSRTPLVRSETNPAEFSATRDFGNQDYAFFLGDDDDNYFGPTSNVNINISSGSWTGTFSPITLEGNTVAPDYLWTLPAYSGLVTVTANLETNQLTVTTTEPEPEYPEFLYVTNTTGLYERGRIYQDPNTPGLFVGDVELPGGYESCPIVITKKLVWNSELVTGIAFGSTSDDTHYIQNLQNGEFVGKFKTYTGYNEWDIRYWPGGSIRITMNFKTNNIKFEPTPAEIPTLYVIGEGEGLTMDYANPMEIKRGSDITDTNYVFTINNLSSISISTAKGSKEEFEAAALTLAENPTGEDVRLANTLSLVKGSALMETPEVCNYEVSVNLYRYTIKFWALNPAVEFEYLPATDLFASQEPDSQEVTVYWEGPTNPNVAPILGYNVLFNDKVVNEEMVPATENFWKGTIETAGDYTVVVETVYDEQTIKSEPINFSVQEVSGIETLTGDEASVYFDVNGRRVVNPEKGIYIRVVNGKAIKQVIK